MKLKNVYTDREITTQRKTLKWLGNMVYCTFFVKYALRIKIIKS